MKALIAMSGGVDSAVAALLTQQEGWDCLGCTMKLYQNEDAGISREKSCCSLDDVEDARAVAFRMGIPHYVFNSGKRSLTPLSAPISRDGRQTPALTATTTSNSPSFITGPGSWAVKPLSPATMPASSGKTDDGS